MQFICRLRLAGLGVTRRDATLKSLLAHVTPREVIVVCSFVFFAMLPKTGHRWIIRSQRLCCEGSILL